MSLLVACAHARSPASEPAGATEAETGEREPVEEEGTASYYGDELAGHPMASGAPYRPEAMTCAHRTHRMGARLRVTNLENGRTVVVVVTDRGPFIHGRIVDLSAAAARALDMLARGVARVRVKRL